MPAQARNAYEQEREARLEANRRMLQVRVCSCSEHRHRTPCWRVCWCALGVVCSCTCAGPAAGRQPGSARAPPRSSKTRFENRAGCKRIPPPRPSPQELGVGQAVQEVAAARRAMPPPAARPASVPRHPRSRPPRSATPTERRRSSRTTGTSINYRVSAIVRVFVCVDVCCCQCAAHGVGVGGGAGGHACMHSTAMCRPTRCHHPHPCQHTAQ